MNITGRGVRRSARAAGRRDPCGGRTPRSSRSAPRAPTSARRRTGLPAVELVGVSASALVLVQHRDVLDVGGGQLEAEDVDVLPDPVRGDRLGKHDVAPLDVPAQYDLGRGLAGPFGDGPDGWVIEDAPLSQ